MNYWLWALSLASAPALVVLATLAARIALRTLQAAEHTAQETRKSVEKLDLSLRVDVILRLDERFNAPALLQARVKAARCYLYRDPVHPPSEVDDIFDFFSMLGLLLEEGALDERLTYAFFFAWILHYVIAFEAYVLACRLHEPAVWRNVRRLFDRLLEVECKKAQLPREAVIPDGAALEKWFEEEAALLSS